MVDSIINNTLQSLGVPVARLYYRGDAETFITFQLVLGARTIFADDICEGEEYIYRADVYSRNDWIALVKKAVATLDVLECYEITIDPESFESDTGYFHVPITFKIIEKTEV